MHAEVHTLLQVLADERLHMPDLPKKGVLHWRDKLKLWGATISDQLDASVTRQVVPAHLRYTYSLLHVPMLCQI